MPHVIAKAAFVSMIDAHVDALEGQVDWSDDVIEGYLESLATLVDALSGHLKQSRFSIGDLVVDFVEAQLDCEPLLVEDIEGGLGRQWIETTEDLHRLIFGRLTKCQHPSGVSLSVVGT